MLGIIIDAGVLMLLVAAVNDNDEVDFLKAALVAFAMSLGLSFVVAGLGGVGGLGGVLLGLIPAAAVAGLIAWVTLGLTLQRAMIVGGLFLLIVIGRVLLFQWLFSS